MQDDTAGATTPTHPGAGAALEPYVRGLNPEQAEAVRTLGGPLIVVAGPGSGKTRVLTHRIAAIVGAGYAAPWQILAVTFTNKAAEEMRERVAGLLPEVDPRRMWISTFHSFCAKFLRIEAAAAGLPSSYSILDTGDVRTVLRDIHRTLELPDDAAAIKQSASTISRVKNGMSVRPDTTMTRVMEAYQSRLARLGSLDFDDLLLRTLELLRTDEEVRRRWQDRFRYVMVDEYQDTNRVQYDIVGLIAQRHRNICVVGDADQSIYGFRAATPEALATFNEDWQPDAQVVILGENYRSTPEILEVCQSVIDANPSEFRPRLRTDNPSGSPVRLIVHEDDRGEARFVANEARRALGRGSVAVLMRTNAQTRSLEEALLQEGLAYTVVGALRFYERAEIKDAIAYLKLAVNPTDALSLARAISSPRRGIGPKALAALEEAAGDGDLLETVRAALAADRIGRGRQGFESFLELMDTVRDAIETDGPVVAVRRILDGGLREHVRAHGGENAMERLENLDELLSGAAEFATRNTLGEIDETGAVITPRRLTELYLERIALTSGAEEGEAAGPGAVQLLTAHASKGKEFDTVHVIGVEENLFPHGRRGEVSDEREERRLLFVACSRARTSLTMHRAARRFMHGNLTENPASRFLADLPAAVETIDRSRTWPSGLRTGGRGTQGHSRAESWGRPGWRPEPRGGGRTTPPAARNAGSGGGTEAAILRNNGPRVDATALAAGTRVRHTRFGEGTVKTVNGTPGEEIATIRFADGTDRQFKVSLTPLEIVA